jgi:hypothetical protein
MKRNFLMKAFVCLFTVVALSSCDKNENEEEEAKSGAIGNTLTVAVENGNSYNSRIDTVKLTSWDESAHTDREIASANYANGGFTITLPETVSSQYLEPITSLLYDYDEEGVPSGVTVSNSEVKIYDGADCFEAYKSSRNVGEIMLVINESYFEFYGVLTYVDGDVSITGTGTETNNDYIYISEDGVAYPDIKYDVHLKKGWNIVYYKEIDYDHLVEATTTAPAGVKWYFYSYDYDESSVSGSRAKTPFLQGKQKLRF